MKKLFGIFVLCFLAIGSASANKKFLTLEEAATNEAKKWQQTGVAKPIMSDDGKLIFPYGQYMPTIVCSQLRACDIELQPGELFSGKPLAGDTARWIISQFKSGAGDKAINHVVIKPTDVNLETNLIIPTDRRTYHVRMKASEAEGEYMNRVGFYYPQEMTEEWNQTAKLTERDIAAKERLVVSELPNAAVEQLDFDYKIEGGDRTITPLRVFNDGKQVYIQMSKAMTAAEAPVLLAKDSNGNVQLVNFRVKDLYYIVDKLFDRATLVAGSEGSKSEVEITWTKHKKSNWFW